MRARQSPSITELARKWHFQSTHHDIWDWDTPAAPLVVDLPNGEEAVVQTLKQSHLFMFDPDTGKPIFAVEERPVPASDTPNEITFPTQPFPVLPAPYDRQGFQEEDLNDMTPTILAKAKEIASKYRFSELYTPPSLYQHPADGSLGTLHLPSSTGGSNWKVPPMTQRRGYSMWRRERPPASCHWSTSPKLRRLNIFRAERARQQSMGSRW